MTTAELSVGVRPKAIPPSIWAATVSGLTTKPQSTQQFPYDFVFETLGVLRLRRVHIGPPPCASRHDTAVNSDLSSRVDRDFGDLGCPPAVTMVDGGKLEHNTMTRRRIKQLKSELHRVLAGGMR